MGKGNTSMKKRKYWVDVEAGRDFIARTVDVMQRLNEATGIKRDIDYVDLKKNWEDDMLKSTKRAHFLSIIEDLKEIQSKLDELRANFSKEKEALEAMSDSTKSQHDNVEATFIKEKEALEAKYHKLYVVQYTKRLDDEFKANMCKATRALEANYLKLCEPLYTKRCEVVNGGGHVGCATEGMTDFWLTVMKSNAVLLMEIKEDDEEALKLLKDIKLRNVEPKGFKLEFYFADNTFFKNQILTKTYQMVHEDDVVPKSIIGTRIAWYRRRCLTKMVRATERGKSDSFFNFFSPLQVPDDDGDIAEELLTQRRYDYEIGCALADIIPNAISRYLEFADIGELPGERIDESEIGLEYSD